MGKEKLKSAISVLFFAGICLLISSCGAIQEARSREYTKKKAPKTAKVKHKSPKSGTSTSQSNTTYNKDVISKYEKILGVSIEKGSAPLYNFVDHWMGVPYCYGGMSMKCTDCSGFVLNLYQEVYHIELPHTAVKQFEMSRKIKQKDLREGELVFFDTDQGKETISHVGVYLGNNKFVHASSSKGVRIDDLDEKYYKEAFRGGGSLN